MGWREFVGDAGRIVGLNHYGASAAYTVLYEEFGLTDEAVVAAARESIAAAARRPRRPGRPGRRRRPAPPHRRPLTRLARPGPAQPERHLTWHRTRSWPSCPTQGSPSGSTTSPATASAAATCSRWSTSTRVVGVTTNPTIFAAAISGSDSYDDQVHALAVRKVSVEEALRTITAADVRDACDLLGRSPSGSPATAGSPSRSPRAWRTTPTRPPPRPAHLWWLVDRPNLFIKIPATEAGLPAITETIANGISVNVTLIFSLERYRAVMDAYLAGLEKRVGRAAARSSGIASVASFFVSRVDTEIDKRLDKAGADAVAKGKAGIANAQLAYQAYEEVFSSDRWRALEAKGAVPQRPLWASTGVKNPEYSRHDVHQRAHRPGHGQHHAREDDDGLRRPRQPRHAGAEGLRRRRRRRCRPSADAGVDLDDVFRVLEDEGVQKFVDSWDELTESVRTELEDKE